MTVQTDTRAPSARGREAARHLQRYLSDHDAAAAGGNELVQRCRRANEHTVFAHALTDLERAIVRERVIVRDLLLQAGGRPSRVKRAAAWFGASLGRLPLNGHLLTYSPMSRVLELEALSAAVTAKLRLWQTLADLGTHDRRFDEARFRELAQQARAQLVALEGLHRIATELAFAAATPAYGA